MGSPRLGQLGAGGLRGRGAARQEGALAELGVTNDVQQLFVASSITPYFSLEL